jgi:ankyrin repeat protein
MDSYPLYSLSLTNVLDIHSLKQFIGSNGSFDINKKYGVWNQTLLHVLVRRGLLDCVEYLVDNYVDIDINALDKYNDTPLHDAAFLGKFRIVKYLLGKGADKDLLNYDGFTACDKVKIGQPHDMMIAEYIESYESLPTKGVFMS